MPTVRFLAPEEYPAWDALVDASPSGSIFAYSWWLKTVCKEPRLLGCFDNGSLVGGTPLYFEKKFGFRLCTSPKLTATWGPVLAQFSEDPIENARRQTEALNLFAEQLSKYTVVFQRFHPTLRNSLPFQWHGFWQTARCTYQFDDLSDLNHIWKGMDHRTRGEIRKGQRLGLKIEACEVEEVFEAERKTFARQGLGHPHSVGEMRRLYDAARAHDAGRCFAAKDESGRVHAAGLIVWDRRSAYYIAAGADPALRSSGATSVLAWHMIQFSATKTRTFDFSGSSIESIERLFRYIGARQVPCFWILKAPAWLRAYLAVAGKF